MLYKLGDGQIRIGSVSGIGDKLSNVGPKNYLIKQDRNNEFYLVETTGFKLPSKVYGDVSITERWLKSYEQNSHKNLGILLSGLKGSGKTILAQKFCVDSKKPVLILTEAFYGSNFIEFLSSPVFEECIVFIDEFEKIYPKDKMPIDLLSLFDGNLTTKLVFLVTVNDVNLVSDFMINRPGRIKYRKHYENLELNTINEVIDDLLINKDNRDDLLKQLKKLGIVTFDILITIIKDMNLFEEDAKSVVKHLNVSSEASHYVTHEKFGDSLYKCNEVYTNLHDDQLYIDIFRTQHSSLMRVLNLATAKIFKHGYFGDLSREDREQVKTYVMDNQLMTLDDYNYASSNNYSSCSLILNYESHEDSDMIIESIDFNNHDLIKVSCRNDVNFVFEHKFKSKKNTF